MHQQQRTEQTGIFLHQQPTELCNCSSATRAKKLKKNARTRTVQESLAIRETQDTAAATWTVSRITTLIAKHWIPEWNCSYADYLSHRAGMNLYILM